VHLAIEKRSIEIPCPSGLDVGADGDLVALGRGQARFERPQDVERTAAVHHGEYGRVLRRAGIVGPDMPAPGRIAEPQARRAARVAAVAVVMLEVEAAFRMQFAGDAAPGGEPAAPQTVFGVLSSAVE